MLPSHLSLLAASPRISELECHTVPELLGAQRRPIERVSASCPASERFSPLPVHHLPGPLRGTLPSCVGNRGHLQAWPPAIPPEAPCGVPTGPPLLAFLPPWVAPPTWAPTAPVPPSLSPDPSGGVVCLLLWTKRGLSGRPAHSVPQGLAGERPSEDLKERSCVCPELDCIFMQFSLSHADENETKTFDGLFPLFCLVQMVTSVPWQLTIHVICLVPPQQCPQDQVQS